ncbi:MAG: hypothetical protein AUJ96_28395 [Armatimonadetes bacterium CG2_30_66_41]|nr:MAG: hypothetical protein AUJ96_28395 [Armatimonadetes bacterium CG2_30_66_41]
MWRVRAVSGILSPRSCDMATWQPLATITESTVGSWTGTPLPVPLPAQFRVAAVDAMGGEAVGNVVEVGV